MLGSTSKILLTVDLALIRYYVYVIGSFFLFLYCQLKLFKFLLLVDKETLQFMPLIVSVCRLYDNVA